MRIFENKGMRKEGRCSRSKELKVNNRKARGSGPMVEEVIRIVTFYFIL